MSKHVYEFVFFIKEYMKDNIEILKAFSFEWFWGLDLTKYNFEVCVVI